VRIATFSLMTEVDAEHVERDGAWLDGVSVGRKPETCPRVDETADKPGRSHAIDAGTWSRNPESPLVRVARSHACGLGHGASHA
jgi:hypothetical protein